MLDLYSGYVCTCITAGCNCLCVLFQPNVQLRPDLHLYPHNPPPLVLSVFHMNDN